MESVASDPAWVGVWGGGDSFWRSFGGGDNWTNAWMTWGAGHE